MEKEIENGMKDCWCKKMKSAYADALKVIQSNASKDSKRAAYEAALEVFQDFTAYCRECTEEPLCRGNKPDWGSKLQKLGKLVL